jgi:hypothetical protein
MEIGKFNTLTIMRVDKGGVLLSDGTEETYLPGPEVTPDMKEGQELTVFVYNSQKNETRATLQTPKGQVGEFAYMKVVDVNPLGAFLDWGIPKDLMVPPGTQKWPLKKDEGTVVFIAEDSRRKGIIGFTNLSPFFSKDFSELKSGQKVDILVWGLTPLGAKVIVENKFSGLVYKQDMDKPIEPGQRLTGWIRRIRKDGKLDIGLWEKNIEKSEDFKARLLEALRSKGGMMPLTDKTDPQVFRTELNMSKRVFKMTAGMLSKEGKIEIHETGITLPGVEPPRKPKVLKVKARDLSSLVKPGYDPLAQDQDKDQKSRPRGDRENRPPRREGENRSRPPRGGQGHGPRSGGPSEGRRPPGNGTRNNKPRPK